MNKTLVAVASIALAASATSAAAGGSTKGTGGYNGVAQTGLSTERAGGSTKGTGGMNGVSRAGLTPAGRQAQAVDARQTSMKVLSVTLPAKVDVAPR
jgi:hypothetical protein